MRTVAVLVLILVASLPRAEAADSVVMGHAISNVYSDVPDCCPEGFICMDSWTKWVLDTKRTLAGPTVSGRVVAVRMQHTVFNDRARREQRLFVLRPIEKETDRNLLKADYYLVDTSGLEKMYCIGSEPSEVGLDVSSAFKSTDPNWSQYCFFESDLEP